MEKRKIKCPYFRLETSVWISRFTTNNFLLTPDYAIKDSIFPCSKSVVISSLDGKVRHNSVKGVEEVGRVNPFMILFVLFPWHGEYGYVDRVT